MTKPTQLASRCSAALLAAALLAPGLGCGDDKPRAVDPRGPGQSVVSKHIDIQDFNQAAARLTNKFLASPRMQKELASVDPQSGLPLMIISRIRNDTGYKINMVDYLVSPIEEVLVNSGKLDFVSEDQTGQKLAAAQEIMGNAGQPRIPTYLMNGVVTRLSTTDGSTKQNAFVFRITVVRTADNSVVFQDHDEIAKQFGGGGGGVSF